MSTTSHESARGLYPPEKSLKVGPYILMDTIGFGSTSKVKLAVKEIKGGSFEHFACKVMYKNAIRANTNSAQVRNEIDAMRKLSHHNVVSFEEVVSSSSKVYIFMELVEGKELFKIIDQYKGLPEPYARYIFLQIIEGIQHCHEQGVYHRDLKPENVMVTKDNVVKITDFGLSNLKVGGTARMSSQTGSVILKTQCGTPNYVAPEIITIDNDAGERYSGSRVDIWACGIVLFALVAGYLPFESPYTDILFKSILSGEVPYPSFFSEELKDLIRNILKQDPKDRYSLKDILGHAWLSGPFDHTMDPFYVRNRDPDPVPNVNGSIEQMQTHSNSHRAASQNSIDGHEARGGRSSYVLGDVNPADLTPGQDMCRGISVDSLRYRTMDSLDLGCRVNTAEGELQAPCDNSCLRPGNDPVLPAAVSDVGVMEGGATSRSFEKGSPLRRVRSAESMRSVEYGSDISTGNTNRSSNPIENLETIRKSLSMSQDLRFAEEHTTKLAADADQRTVLHAHSHSNLVTHPTRRRPRANLSPAAEGRELHSAFSDRPRLNMNTGGEEPRDAPGPTTRSWTDENIPHGSKSNVGGRRSNSVRFMDTADSDSNAGHQPYHQLEFDMDNRQLNDLWTKGLQREQLTPGDSPPLIAPVLSALPPHMIGEMVPPSSGALPGRFSPNGRTPFETRGLGDALVSPRRIASPTARLRGVNENPQRDSSGGVNSNQPSPAFSSGVITLGQGEDFMSGRNGASKRGWSDEDNFGAPRRRWIGDEELDDGSIIPATGASLRATRNDVSDQNVESSNTPDEIKPVHPSLETGVQSTDLHSLENLRDVADPVDAPKIDIPSPPMNAAPPSSKHSLVALLPSIASAKRLIGKGQAPLEAKSATQFQSRRAPKACYGILQDLLCQHGCSVVKGKSSRSGERFTIRCEYKRAKDNVAVNVMITISSFDEIMSLIVFERKGRTSPDQFRRFFDAVYKLYYAKTCSANTSNSG